MATKLDWAIIPNKITVTSVIPQAFHYYDLYNLSNAEALCYGRRSHGINLVWADPAKSDNIRFQRKGSEATPIKFEESIAIHIRGGKFLVYQKDRRGINLGWSDQPKFEWKFMGGNAGEEVKPGITVGLFNTVENDFLMYEARDWGINLKWLKDSGRFTTLTDAIRMAKDAKPYAIAIARLIGGG